jgi:hypothetical protein
VDADSRESIVEDIVHADGAFSVVLAEVVPHCRDKADVGENPNYAQAVADLSYFRIAVKHHKESDVDN